MTASMLHVAVLIVILTASVHHMRSEERERERENIDQSCRSLCICASVLSILIFLYVLMFVQLYWTHVCLALNMPHINIYIIYIYAFYVCVEYRK
jgi:hypothetical protein